MLAEFSDGALEVLCFTDEGAEARYTLAELLPPGGRWRIVAPGSVGYEETASDPVELRADYQARLTIRLRPRGGDEVDHLEAEVDVGHLDKALGVGVGVLGIVDLRAYEANLTAQENFTRMAERALDLLR